MRFHGVRSPFNFRIAQSRGALVTTAVRRSSGRYCIVAKDWDRVVGDRFSVTWVRINADILRSGSSGIVRGVAAPEAMRWMAECPSLA